MANKNDTVKRKILERTCVACGAGERKECLVRFVRTKEGAVLCDETGRVAGRGAYLCAREDCFETAKKRGKLGRALRCTLSAEDHSRLEQSFRAVCAKRKQLA